MDINLILIGIGIAIVFLVAGVAIGEAAGASKVNDIQRRLLATKDALTVARFNYANVHGLWATDRPNLIESPRLKTLFYRIGYPGEKL